MTIEEAKDIVAVKHGYPSYAHLQVAVNCGVVKADKFDAILNETTLIHTKHHVEQALKAASENIEVITDPWGGYLHVNKDSILNAYPIENIQ